MFTGTLKSKIRVNLSNAYGWSSNRKIIVLESDDWGSIRTKDKTAYDRMLKSGLDVNKNIYTTNDCLGSNDDLELLFDLFSEFKDSTGRPPVLTPMCMMANPDFEKIKASGFQDYYFEGFEKTLSRYPNHDRVLELWNKGVEERLFVPGLHGREHINVLRWMQNVGTKDAPLRAAFDNESFGASHLNGQAITEYLGAFHPESVEEIVSFKAIIKDAGDLFHDYLGYRPTCFIAPNREEPRELEYFLKDVGVKYMTRSKKRRYPTGDGNFKLELNWLGKRAKSGQLSLVRNCFFEPINDKEYSPSTDWVDNCLKEIEIAFRWKKPAVISTHRVNFVGTIQTKYRDKGFKELRSLFKSILKKWPETEFMTSSELGMLMEQKS